MKSQELYDMVCLWMAEYLRILWAAKQGTHHRLSDELASVNVPEEMARRFSETIRGSGFKDLPARADVVAFLLAYHLIEAVTFECCRISFLEEPGKWEKEMNDLEQQPLLKKLNLLFKKTGIKAPRQWGSIKGYRYSWKRMKEINILRNVVTEICESLDPENSKFELPGSEKDIEYIESTCFFLMEVVAFCYNLEIEQKTVGGDRLLHRRQMI